jgi:methyl-accepting chemotaxis protein
VVESITGIRQVIEQINEMQSTVAAAVEEQSATTSEINRGISEAAPSSSEVRAFTL